MAQALTLLRNQLGEAGGESTAELMHFVVLVDMNLAVLQGLPRYGP